MSGIPVILTGNAGKGIINWKMVTLIGNTEKCHTEKRKEGKNALLY